MDQKFSNRINPFLKVKKDIEDQMSDCVNQMKDMMDLIEQAWVNGESAQSYEKLFNDSLEHFLNLLEAWLLNRDIGLDEVFQCMSEELEKMMERAKKG